MKFDLSLYLKAKESSLDESYAFLEQCEVNSVWIAANTTLAENNAELALELFESLYSRVEEKHKILLNMGLCNKSAGRVNTAIDCALAAVKLNPQYVLGYFFLFECYAYTGDYFTAWQYQEWSFGDSVLNHPSLDISKKRRLDWSDPYVQWALYNREGITVGKPEITEEEQLHIYSEITSSITNKRIWIMSSQGLGDIIQTTHLVKRLLEFYPQCVLLCVRPELFRVVSYMFAGEERVQICGGMPSESDYDFFIPLYSVYKLLTVDSSTVDPWFSINPIEVSFSRHLMKNPGKTLGIVWRGNPAHSNDAKRSLTLQQLVTMLGDVSDKQLYSLQFDVTPEEKALLAELGIVDCSSKIRDLYDIGCFLSNLDLFVTIDSAPLHLAGALGVNTLALLPEGFEDWRWGITGDRKWYSSVKLIRFKR